MAPVSNVVAYWLMLHVIVIEMQNCNNFDQVTILVGQTWKDFGNTLHWIIIITFFSP